MKLRKKDDWNQPMRHELRLHCDGQPVGMHTHTHTLSSPGAAEGHRNVFVCSRFAVAQEGSSSAL